MSLQVVLLSNNSLPVVREINASNLVAAAGVINDLEPVYTPILAFDFESMKAYRVVRSLEDDAFFLSEDAYELLGVGTMPSGFKRITGED